MNHLLIIIPGLGDRKSLLEFTVSSWEKKYGIKTFVHCMPWQGAVQEIEPKLDTILALIDSYCSDGYKVSLLGTSAGGSAVLNAYAMRKDKIHKVINVCGRLRKGEGVFPTLEQASRESKSFYDSVIRCEENLKLLTNDDRMKILTFRPLFDELVPRDTVTVSGATNILLPTIEHMLSISLAMTLYSNRIVDLIMRD